MRRRLILFIIGLTLSASPVAAQDFSSFEIEDIRVLGLRRFDPGVVFNRLKVEPGERFTSDDAVVLIRELYKSGYFSSVEGIARRQCVGGSGARKPNDCRG